MLFARKADIVRVNAGPIAFWYAVRVSTICGLWYVTRIVRAKGEGVVRAIRFARRVESISGAA